MRRLAIAAVLLAASGFSARAEDVTIKMSMSEFYRIVENVKASGTYKAEKRLPAVRAWMVRQIESGKAVPDIAIPAPVVLDDTTVRPKFATREYKSGEKVFLLGDSITQNAGAHRFGYDKLLKKGLEVWGKTDVKVVNHGRSGSTTCWMRGEAQKPDWDWLFLEAGINDANKDWWWDGVITNYTGNVTELDSFRHPENHPTAGKRQDFCANVLDIVRKSKAAGAQVILATTTCNGECNRAWWFARHEPSLREHTKYNPMYREIAHAEQVPLIDFWKYWVGGPYLRDDGTPAPEEYVGFIETNKLRSCEKLMEGRDDVFLSDDNTHLYFQGYRDIARRLLTVMGCPASKMPEIEKAWWDMPEVYDVKLSLPAELHAKIKAGAAAAGVSAGKYVHDVILFPVGKSSGPFAPRKMNGTWVSMGTSITWRNDHVPKKPENAIKGLTRGYQDRVRDVLAFDGFRNLGCNGGTIGIQLGSVAPGDYYTIEHGINDWSHSVPVGTIEDYRHASRTNHTFCATYRKLIDKIRALNPKAKIILCTPRKGYGFHGHLPSACDQPRKGIYLHEYADAVRAIAAEEKLPVADFYATCGEQDELKSLSIDVALHPNDAGYQRMADELLKAFAAVKEN